MTCGRGLGAAAGPISNAIEPRGLPKALNGVAIFGIPGSLLGGRGHLVFPRVGVRCFPAPFDPAVRVYTEAPFEAFVEAPFPARAAAAAARVLLVLFGLSTLFVLAGWLVFAASLDALAA